MPAETVNEDMVRIEKEIYNAVSNAMPYLADTMKNRLKEHIEDDVYRAYTPKAYPRRSENPSFGTALNDVETNTVTVIGNDSVIIDYLPDGFHSGTKKNLLGKYSQDSTAPIIPNPAHGDDLVRRIETGEGYDWHFNEARPFFTKFTSDMLEGGEAEKALVEGMKMAKPDLEITVTGTVVRDGTEWI